YRCLGCVDARLRGQNSFSMRRVFHTKVDGRNREARRAKCLEILRRRVLLQLRSLGSGHQRAQHNLAVGLFRELQETRSQRHRQNGFAGRRIQNAFPPCLAEPPNPRQRAEQGNLIRGHVANRSIDAFARRLDSNGMELVELVGWHKFIQMCERSFDSLRLRRQLRANQKHHDTAHNQHQTLQTGPNVEECQRPENGKAASKKKEETGVNEDCAEQIHGRDLIYSLKSSRMRLICARLTGISVCFLSLILSIKLDLNHGTTSLM